MTECVRSEILANAMKFNHGQAQPWHLGSFSSIVWAIVSSARRSWGKDEPSVSNEPVQCVTKISLDVDTVTTAQKQTAFFEKQMP